MIKKIKISKYHSPAYTYGLIDTIEHIDYYDEYINYKLEAIKWENRYWELVNICDRQFNELLKLEPTGPNSHD